MGDKVFCATFFHNRPDLYDVWVNIPPHPLQEQEPLGDRQWIDKFEILQNLVKFEKSINVEFKHIRLLARAFTDRSVGYTNLTMGSNQRLEFLGDTVLQLIASEYLYKYFPEHHEGHLSVSRNLNFFILQLELYLTLSPYFFLTRIILVVLFTLYNDKIIRIRR